jgi:hypothetical protein
MEQEMADLEKRLKALEKRAQKDDDRWQMLDAQSKALPMILRAICAPICAADPGLLRAIIANLRTFEESSRLLNEHSILIGEFRRVRLSLERPNSEEKGEKPPG